MCHLAIAVLAIMVICEAEDETADMTFAGLLRGAEKTCQLKNPGRIPVWELPLVVESCHNMTSIPYLILGSFWFNISSSPVSQSLLSSHPCNDRFAWAVKKDAAHS